MVTKLAEERESRAREGMKMMGLKDRSYFIGWFIFLLLINLIIATLISGSENRSIQKFKLVADLEYVLNVRNVTLWI